ncbi:ImuA family protein [Aestuariibius sp. HNIBRBA575]|uniref:ImuA family protein n=1 Tax=Aestuariibius sp. HNIBRBA575 TaxID=3233343 RepID=UPI0034A59855
MSLGFSDHFPPKPNRAHEVFGAGAITFAAILAGRLNGPVMWIREAWRPENLNPEGFAPFFAPHQLLISQCKDQPDMLAVAEESLRSGAVKLTVAELSQPLGLTQGRRLQLAAEAGRSTGLFVIQDGMGSNAAETRWQCDPVLGPQDSTLFRWSLKKNKSGTLTSWDLSWDAETRRLHVVSPSGQ